MTVKLRPQEVHVWHLDMNEPTPKKHSRHHLYELRKVQTALPELNRFLYVTVGAPWMWHMRLNWSWQQWADFLARDGVETWVAYQGGTPVGYFELECQHRAQTEITYFGLVPEYVGKGLGKALLEDAIENAWQLAEQRIWLHTCSLDHPAALPNYLARGFKIFKEEEYEDMIPSESIEPWPGANKPSII